MGEEPQRPRAHRGGHGHRGRASLSLRAVHDPLDRFTYAFHVANILLDHRIRWQRFHGVGLHTIPTVVPRQLEKLYGSGADIQPEEDVGLFLE